jgi:hypothetical protein
MFDYRPFALADPDPVANDAVNPAMLDPDILMGFVPGVVLFHLVKVWASESNPAGSHIMDVYMADQQAIPPTRAIPFPNATYQPPDGLGGIRYLKRLSSNAVDVKVDEYQAGHFTGILSCKIDPEFSLPVGDSQPVEPQVGNIVQANGRFLPVPVK